MKKALNEIGEEVIIKFMVLAYLQANFLREGISEKDFGKMASLASVGKSLNQAQFKTLRALGKIAFQLSERFRFQTTGFHLRLAGIKTPMEDLFDFHFLDSLENLDQFLNSWVAVFK